MIEKKTRITRASSPRYTTLSRSSSPDIQNKKSKSSANETKTISKKPPKPKPNIVNEDLEEINHDLCDACHGPGRFLCCEGCPNVFHFGCVDPPMDTKEVDELEGEWFCNQCLHQRKGIKASSSSIHRTKNKRKGSLFELMAQNLESSNPVAFSLPENIRNYFDGVSTGPNGAYVDATTIKAIKYRNGRPEEQDYHRLKDKNGHFIFCYWCHRTALKKPMISCDFCPLYWHLDCLDPPLTIPPNIAKKWRCPCHAQHHIRYRTPKNSTATENDDPFMPQPPSISTSLLNDFSGCRKFETCTPAQQDRKTDLNENNNNQIFDNENPIQQQQQQQQQQNLPQNDPATFNLDDFDTFPFITKPFGNNFMSSSNRLLTKKDRKLKKSSCGNTSVS